MWHQIKSEICIVMTSYSAAYLHFLQCNVLFQITKLTYQWICYVNLLQGRDVHSKSFFLSIYLSTFITCTLCTSRHYRPILNINLFKGTTEWQFHSYFDMLEHVLRLIKILTVQVGLFLRCTGKLRRFAFLWKTKQ